MKDFIELAMKNIGKVNQDVNNMSIKARMTRYHALEAQVDAILRELYAVDYQADAEEMMSGLYQETYHRTSKKVGTRPTFSYLFNSRA